MNEIAKSITRMIQGGQDILVRRSGDRIIIDSTVEQQRRRGGGGGGQKSLEVRIVRAIATASDTTDQDELDTFNQFGAHLKCWAIDADGNFVTMEDEFGELVKVYYVVYPNWPHPISDFKDAMGNQIYNALSPTAPVFTAFSGKRGWTLSFGEGERWVPAPDQAAICPSKDVTTTACCFANETCQDLTPAMCTAAGGMAVGVGTTCFIVDCSLPDPVGACCSAGGSCTQLTMADCVTSGQSYLGNGTSCLPNPCPQPPSSGACCYGTVCLSQTSETCSLSGGVFQGPGTTCSPNPCTGGLLAPPPSSPPSLMRRMIRRVTGG